MQQLWAPWRMEYIEAGVKADGCFLCARPAEGGERDADNYILWRGRRSFVIMNIFPYNNGHLMVVPYAHKAAIADLDADTQAELMAVTGMAVEAVRGVMKPQGFNVGINLGKVAGAGVADHIHIHIVPRWGGDTNFMPVLADVRVMPQHLRSTYELLLPVFKKICLSDQSSRSDKSD